MPDITVSQHIDDLLQSLNSYGSRSVLDTPRTSDVASIESFNALSGYVDNINDSLQSNSANWNSAYDTSNSLNLSSGIWNDTYTSVQSNSSNWNYQGSDLKALSADWVGGNSAYTTVNASSAEWNSAYDVGTIYQSNSASYSTIDFVNSKFLPLSGGIITGETQINNNLTVFGNLTATGTTTFANTIFSVTSALSVVHIGSGPALWIGNNGDGDIASFYDIDEGVEILHVGGINSSNPNVGIKTSTPNKTFTVVGEISSTSDITTSGKIYVENNGNSDQWSSSYTTIQVNSATNWNYQGSDLKSLSADWVGGNTAYTTIQSNSSNWNSAYNTSNSLNLSSGIWNDTYTSVQSNSSNWNYQGLDLKALSADWVGGNSAYTTVNASSANWNSAYTTIQATSSAPIGDASTIIGLAIFI